MSDSRMARRGADHRFALLLDKYNYNRYRYNISMARRGMAPPFLAPPWYGQQAGYNSVSTRQRRY